MVHHSSINVGYTRHLDSLHLGCVCLHQVLPVPAWCPCDYCQQPTLEQSGLPAEYILIRECCCTPRSLYLHVCTYIGCSYSLGVTLHRPLTLSWMCVYLHQVMPVPAWCPCDHCQQPTLEQSGQTEEYIIIQYVARTCSTLLAFQCAVKPHDTSGMLGICGASEANLLLGNLMGFCRNIMEALTM